jgi:hypothetical protein
MNKTAMPAIQSQTNIPPNHQCMTFGEVVGENLNKAGKRVSQRKAIMEATRHTITAHVRKFPSPTLNLPRIPVDHM